MSDTKHTQGPWATKKAMTPSDGGYDYAILTEIDGATVCIAEAFEVVSTQTKIDAQANARLIAAAPETAAERGRLKAVNAELLEALERAICDPYYSDLDAETQYAIGEAITKAKGA